MKYQTTPAQVAAVLERRPSSPGAARLNRVIDGDVKVSLSKLERGFVAHLEADGLPLPETNRVASGRRVDCRWPEQKLTVELTATGSTTLVMPGSRATGANARPARAGTSSVATPTPTSSRTRATCSPSCAGC